AGNYYPVNSRIFIQDTQKGLQFTVLTDRSHGGSSLKDGSVEIMVHRRLQVRADFGEALNETGQFGDGLIIRGRHWVVFDTVANSSETHRLLGEQLLLRPVLAFHRDRRSPSDYNKNYNAVYTAISKALPANVHLLTLQFIDVNTILLRLEHQFEKNEDAVLSRPVTVSLDGFFKAFKIESMTELVLGANEDLSNVHRLVWNTKESTTPKGRRRQRERVKANQITLNPMEIRTFQVKLSPA
ncbi:MAG: glycosyl hydrolase-related protein, partial [Alphaproteobacteria bacterium]|nr:glycosyl hydrolase-related protein [Alphaproteobacteria bacterium]